MISMDEIKERVILVAVDTDGSDQAERSLDELGELAKTAGAEVVGRMIQPRESIHPGTYIGKGKKKILIMMPQKKRWSIQMKSVLLIITNTPARPGEM